MKDGLALGTGVVGKSVGLGDGNEDGIAVGDGLGINDGLVLGIGVVGNCVGAGVGRDDGI